MIASASVEEYPVPGWMRGLEVVAGVMSIILAVFVLANLSVAVVTLLLFLSVGLVFLGIRQITIGVGARWQPGWLRALGVVAGVLSLMMAVLVIAFPGLGVSTLTLLFGFGLPLIGITEIAVGASLRFLPGWLRGVLVAVGVVDLILAPIAVLVPGVAVVTLIVLLAGFLILNGADRFLTATVGRVRVARAEIGTVVPKGSA